MAEHPAEPFRIKSVESTTHISRAEREAALKRAHYNLFWLKSDEIYLDFLTDSGTGSMSDKQWSDLLQADESYAGASSFQRLESAVKDIFGMKYVIPTHQGRAAENILASLLVQPGSQIPNNTHFDTTEANIMARGGLPVNLAIEEARDPANPHPFKGNMDLEKLEAFVKETGADNIPFGMSTITNNAVGGQPVSMENLRATSKVYHSHGIPFFIDASRHAENAYFIQQREEGYRDKSPLAIAREVFSLADGVTMSGKKDGIANIGGFLGVNDDDLYSRAAAELVIREGFLTYGGMSGRAMEALATGLYEALELPYLAYRIGQIRYFGEKLLEIGIPIIQPPGGHGIYIDAGALLPHIPVEQFPGQALSVALYLEGGIRGVELGSVAFAHEDPETGQVIRPPLELVRLAVPRRTYTQSHLDYAVGVLAAIKDQAETIGGYRIAKAPELLRHFLAEFEPA